MDTIRFLDTILPDNAVRFLAIKKDKGYAHRAFTNVTEMASTAVSLSDKGYTVYHACAGFEKERIWDSKKERWRYRTQDNAKCAKSLWLDLDCGEGKAYESQRDALVGVIQIAKLIGPPTYTVSSGYGIHCYWSFTKSIPAAQWKKLAAVFRAVLDFKEVSHDPSRTTDIASVLRPVGTDNFKRRTPKSVRVLKEGPLYDVRDIAATLTQIAKQQKLPVQHTKPKPSVPSTNSLNSDLAGGMEYAPATAMKIADKCQQVANIRDTLGDVEEPLWYAAIGLLKYTIEGDDICHAWSEGHPDYDNASCQGKIDQWSYGPTTCAKFENLAPELCAGCKYNGKVTSPIALGRAEPKQVNEMVVVSEPISETANPDIPDAPAKERTVELSLPDSITEWFRWNGSQLMYKQWDKDTEEHVWYPLCESFIKPLGFYNDVDKGYCLLMEQYSRERGRSEFTIKGADIVAGGKGLFETLGAAHVPLVYGTKRAMEAYLSSWFNEIKKQTGETEIATQYGWQKNGGFLIGNRLYTPDGDVRECLVTGDAALLAPAMMPTGSLDVWKRMVNTAYGAEGQEQYQFIFGAGYGAPLMPLLGAVPGLVVSGVSYETGRGKTTAQRLAMGIYGKPTALEMTAKQTTVNAMYIRLGVLNNLPFMLDEVTNVNGMDISNFAYTVSQGQSKLRARGDGTLVNNGRNWCTLVSTSGNRSLVNSVSASKAAAEAEIARILEYKFDNVSTLSKQEADELFSHTNECYGLAGDIYIKYIVTHRTEVKAMLQKLQRKLDAKFDLGRENRFWSAGITCIIGGILIANKLGLHSFNVNRLIDWVNDHVMQNMNAATEDNVMKSDEAFGNMMADIANRFIVTDIEGDLRKKKQAFVHSKPNNGAIDGRVILETGLCYVRVHAIRDWCNDKQVDYKQLLQMAATKGWLKNGKSMYTLSKGTETPMAPCYCITLRLDRMAEDGDTEATNLVDIDSHKKVYSIDRGKEGSKNDDIRAR